MKTYATSGGGGGGTNLTLPPLRGLPMYEESRHGTHGNIRNIT